MPPPHTHAHRVLTGYPSSLTDITLQGRSSSTPTHSALKPSSDPLHPDSDPRPSGTATRTPLSPGPELSRHPSQSDQPPPRAAPADLSACPPPSPGPSPLSSACPSPGLQPRLPGARTRVAPPRGVPRAPERPGPRPAPPRAPPRRAPLPSAGPGGGGADSGQTPAPPPTRRASRHPAAHCGQRPEVRSRGQRVRTECSAERGTRRLSHSLAGRRTRASLAGARGGFARRPNFTRFALCRRGSRRCPSWDLAPARRLCPESGPPWHTVEGPA